MSSDTDISRYGLDPEKLPKHVAIIMDGNGRWAKQRLMNRVRGHEKGADTVRTIVTASREIGIQFLTLYAFSTENWRRSAAEVSALMMLLKRFLVSERDLMMRNDIRLNTIGEIERLPEDVRETLEETLRITAENRSMVLTLALSYGSRAEIIRMVASIARDVRDGVIDAASIDEGLIADRLYTRGMPDPDLLIRTSGEMRISNFLLWQIAYSELAITPTLWPDFDREEYISILQDYQRRERRFGMA
ncbi:MAG: isoprenyl transferase [Thermodesulfobacteriota bacterium]